MVKSRNGETFGSIVFMSLISIKFVLKHIVEASAFIAAKTGLSFTVPI